MFSTGKPLSKALYIIGIVVIFVTVYAQYFVSLGTVVGYLVVYGIPVTVALLFFGREILKRADKNNRTAAKLGLGLFGAFTVLGVFIAVVVLLIILQFNPGVQSLLSKPNPVLNVPPKEAWILIAISFLIVGPAEEFLFRGFMFGGLLSISKGKRWLILAAAHAYYAVTYEAASAVAFIELVAFGIAMCVTYYWSDGNLLVLALIHGAYDATGFLGVATTTLIGNIARGAMIAVGLTFAGLYLPKKLRLSYLQPKPPSPLPPENEIPPPPASEQTSQSQTTTIKE
jgi:membrane protease YdiL (CAAX protease family)